MLFAVAKLLVHNVCIFQSWLDLSYIAHLIFQCEPVAALDYVGYRASGVAVVLMGEGRMWSTDVLFNQSTVAVGGGLVFSIGHRPGAPWSPSRAATGVLKIGWKHSNIYIRRQQWRFDDVIRKVFVFYFKKNKKANVWVYFPHYFRLLRYTRFLNRSRLDGASGIIDAHVFIGHPVGL